MNWYYRDGEKILGPLGVSSIRELKACGMISVATDVRADNSDVWVRFDQAFGSADQTNETATVERAKAPIKFHCPHCQQKLSAEATQSGVALQCPACAVDFVIPPATDEVVIQATPPQETATNSSTCPEDSPEITQLEHEATLQTFNSPALPVADDSTGATKIKLVGRRCLAFFIDSLVALVLLYLIAMVSHYLRPSAPLQLVFILLGFAAFTFYFYVMEQPPRMASYGKRLCGLKLVSLEEGGVITFRQAVTGTAIMVAPFILIVLLTFLIPEFEELMEKAALPIIVLTYVAYFATSLWSPENCTLQDKFSRTRVVKRVAETSATDLDPAFNGNPAAQIGAKFVTEGWAGLKRRSKQAALKAQIEKLRNIDLRKALHSLGKKAFEQGVVADGVAEKFQALRDLDARIAEMRDKASVDAGETKMAALKRVSKDTAKASQAQALAAKREHLTTELGREIHARKAQMSMQELIEESATIVNIEHRIRDKEVEMQGLDDGGNSRIQTLAVTAVIGLLAIAGVLFGINLMDKNDEQACRENAPSASQSERNSYYKPTDSSGSSSYGDQGSLRREVRDILSQRYQGQSDLQREIETGVMSLSEIYPNLSAAALVRKFEEIATGH